MSSPEQFQKDTDVSRETMALYIQWYNLLTHWNKKINLVSSTTISDFWRRHALDSHQLFSCLPKRDVSILDLGSGAGFPGLALALSLKHSCKDAPIGRVTLVESNGKKCNFLRTVVRELSLPANIVQDRVEGFAQMNSEAFDVITARAFAPLSKLLGYSEPFWGGATLGIFPKGRGWQDEIESAEGQWLFDVETRQSQTAEDAKILLVSALKSRDKG